jgi:hypothetical protein
MLYTFLTVLFAICVAGAVIGSCYLIWQYIKSDYNERADEKTR